MLPLCCHTAYILKSKSQVTLLFQDSKSLELVPGLHPLRFKDLAILNVQNIDTFLQVMAGSQKIGTSSAIVCNSLDCLEPPSLAQLQQIYQVPIFSIGPVHKLAPATASSSSLLEEDRSCITWLDKQAPNSVIYVSLETVLASVDEKELTGMPWSLANSNPCCGYLGLVQFMDQNLWMYYLMILKKVL